MPSQEYSVSIPIYMFRFLSILNLILPIGVFNESLVGLAYKLFIYSFSFLAYLAKNNPTLYYYLFI